MLGTSLFGEIANVVITAAITAVGILRPMPPEQRQLQPVQQEIRH
jgi:hypothetical protein